MKCVKSKSFKVMKILSAEAPAVSLMFVASAAGGQFASAPYPPVASPVLPASVP